MASPEILDFSRLLAPISDDHPTGLSLRGSPGLSAIFFQIQNASKAARDLERRALVWQLLSDDDRSKDPDGPPGAPDWETVWHASVDAIAEKSKDLWIVAWLIEALARTGGFAGLRDGFRLVRQLCEQYWAELHPRPDEADGEDITATLSQLSSLNEILIAPIERIAITPRTSSFPPLSGADYKDASESAARSGVTLEMFDSAVREAKPDFFLHLLEDIDAANSEFARLDQMWDEKCGRDSDGMSLAPATSNIKKTLAQCRDRVRSVARNLLGDSALSEGAAQATGGGNQLVPTVGERGSDGLNAAHMAVGNREEAFRALLKVADFFKRTEPHSPVSYKLEEAVRWGRLSLPDLMAELMRDLIHDDSTRHEMYRRVGVEKPKAGES